MSNTALYSKFSTLLLSITKQYRGCLSVLNIDVCISQLVSLKRCVNLIVYSMPRVIARSSRRRSSIRCHGSGHSLGVSGLRYGLTKGAWLQSIATSSNGVSLVSKLSLNSFQAVSRSVPCRSNTVGYIKRD